MLQRAASNAYSWWWASHIRTKQSKWLEQNLQDFEEKVGNTLKLIEEEGDSFAKRAQMYYNNRPLLIIFVQESFRSYRALAERYDHLSTELQKANTTIATVFPEQIQFAMEEEDEYNALKNSKKLPQMGSSNAPKAPAGPVKELKTMFSNANKKFQPKTGNKLPKTSGSSVTKVQKSGLSRPEGLGKIDRLQKEILVLQTEKEFLKISYENGFKKFRGIEMQIVEMQQQVFKLQDEFGDGMFIEDEEARTLMASSALKSCQEALTTLQKKQDKAAKEAANEHDRIKDLREKFEPLRDKFLPDKEKARSGDNKPPKPMKSKDQKKELEKLCGEIKEHFESGEGSSLNVTAMAEKIDELVTKVLSVETDISGETALIQGLRAETDELEAQIQSLEDDKANLEKGSKNLINKLKEMDQKMLRIQEMDCKITVQGFNLQKTFTESRCNLVHLSQKLSSVRPDEELDAIAAAPPVREKKSKKSKKEKGERKSKKKKKKDKESDTTDSSQIEKTKSPKEAEVQEMENSKQDEIEIDEPMESQEESEVQEMENAENSKQQDKEIEIEEPVGSREESEVQEMENSEDLKQDKEIEVEETAKSQEESEVQEMENAENSKQDKEIEAEEPALSQEESQVQEMENSESSEQDKEIEVEEPVESQDQKQEIIDSTSQPEEGLDESQEPEMAETVAEMAEDPPSEAKSAEVEVPEKQEEQAPEKTHDTTPEKKEKAPDSHQEKSLVTLLKEDGGNLEEEDSDEDIFHDVEEPDDEEEELNWRELFMDVQKRLNELEKKSEDGLFDTTLHLKELKNANSMKDEEIKSLRQKLKHLQAKLDAMNDKEEAKPQIPQTPNTSIQVEDEYDMRFLLQAASHEISETEQQFRADIDELLEENLDFWLRFSASFHQIQKFENEIQDLKADASKIIKEKSGEGNNSRTTSLKAEARSIYKHLSEINAELTLWQETSAELKEELQSRFSSICCIQDEITKALKDSAADEDFKFTTFQAAKFQGEILNMKQENNKVADELQAGTDHVSEIHIQVEKSMTDLNEEFGFTGAKNANRQLQHSESRNRVPLRSFIFGGGGKQKKQKQAPSISIFAGVSPVLNLKYNIMK